MDHLAFDTFDVNEYTRTPNVPTRSTIGLARALLKLRPAQSNVVLDKAALRLEATLLELEVSLVERLRSSNREVPVREVDFDRATDGLWISLRDRLIHWSVFEHEGLLALTTDLQAQSDFPQTQKQAARARDLHNRLFGSHGVAFVQQPFLEQAVAMSGLLRLIEADGHDTALAELVGVEWLKTLRACQHQYETMVDDRLVRERSRSLNLSKARNRLRRMITLYNSAVIGLLDDEVPETLDQVVAALRPMVRLREILSRRAAGQGGEPSEDELLGEGEDELIEASAAEVTPAA